MHSSIDFERGFEYQRFIDEQQEKIVVGAIAPPGQYDASGQGLHSSFNLPSSTLLIT
jgi:hypothetical protein